MKRARRFILFVAALTLASLPIAGAAQPAGQTGPIQYLPGLAGDYWAIDSVAADHRYHVFVRYPEGYDAAPERMYPVVYLLDGDTLFAMLAPQHLLLTYDENLPEAIMVGVVYGSYAPPVNRRDYDFSAPAPDAGENQGGAPAFLQFLRTELIPQVEARVQADPSRRVLVGQSRSGYMVLWSALADPDLFWGRIASNPSVVPGREILLSPPR